MEVARQLTDDAVAQAIAAIRAAPTDRDRYLVLSDLLSDRGDPRGELIAVQVALAGAPKKGQPALKRRERELFKRYRDQLLGPGGVVALAHPTWVNGFVHAAQTPPSAPALAALLAHPSAWFLQDLTLQNPFLPLGELVDTVAKSRHPFLKSVAINTLDRGAASLDPIDVTALVQALPGLRTLDVAADEITLRAATSPVEDLSLVSRIPSLGTMQRIAEGHWPRLKSLAIDHFTVAWFAHPELPPQELFRGFATPSLQSLAIRNIPLDAALIEQLRGSALLKRLRVLDLSHCALDEQVLRPFLDHPKSVAHLERFELAGARLTPDQLGSLKR